VGNSVHRNGNNILFMVKTLIAKHALELLANLLFIDLKRGGMGIEDIDAPFLT